MSHPSIMPAPLRISPRCRIAAGHAVGNTAPSAFRWGTWTVPKGFGVLMQRAAHFLIAFIVVGVAIATSGCDSGSTASQTVGGTVTGLSGRVTLTDDGADVLTVSADGRFTFSTQVAQGSHYAVA